MKEEEEAEVQEEGQEEQEKEQENEVLSIRMHGGDHADWAGHILAWATTSFFGGFAASK